MAEDRPPEEGHSSIMRGDVEVSDPVLAHLKNRLQQAVDYYNSGAPQRDTLTLPEHMRQPFPDTGMVHVFVTIHHERDYLAVEVSYTLGDLRIQTVLSTQQVAEELKPWRVIQRTFRTVAGKDREIDQHHFAFELSDLTDSGGEGEVDVVSVIAEDVDWKSMIQELYERL